ncbi:MAG TPA: chemotaxis protein CheW [Capillibacterium sp.]
MAGTDNTMDILNLQFTGSETEKQYIIFSVGDEEFGVDVLRVQEIIRYAEPTKIPHAPDFVEGVINFRGAIIPVLNLRTRFALQKAADNVFTVIIVVEINGKTFGLTVDQVSDILSIPDDKIQPASEFSARAGTEYLKAMGKMGNRLVLILDLDKIISLNWQKKLEEIIEASAPPVPGNNGN